LNSFEIECYKIGLQDLSVTFVADDSGHPTILIVYETGDFRDVLVRELQRKGYLVLTAQNAVETSEIVIRHSRSIHLLLADDGDDSRVMATTLKPGQSQFVPIREFNFEQADVGLANQQFKAMYVLRIPTTPQPFVTNSLGIKRA
jgi:hypothetical protein